MPTDSKSPTRLASRATHAAKWTTISAIVCTGSDISKTIVLARLLMPRDFGLMAMVTIVLGVAQAYVDMGISAAIIYRQDTTKEELSSLYWLNIFVGGCIFALLWVCTPLVVHLFHEPKLTLLLRTTIAVFLIVPVSAQFQVLFQKELAFKLLAGQEIAAALFSLAVGVVVALRGYGVWALVAAFLANSILRTVLLALSGFRRFRPSWHFRRSDLKGYTSFGLFQLGERTLIYLADRTDQVLIGTLLGTSALGYYNFAFNLTARPVQSINPILTRVAFPVFARVQDDLVRLRNGYLKLLEILTMINAPLLIGFAVVAPIAIPTVFGSRWSGSTVIIQVLCIASLLRSTMNPIGSLQLAKGRADMGFWWNVGRLIVYAPVVYAAGVMEGVIGIAFALVFLQALQQVLCYFYIVRPLVGACATDYARVQMRPILIACGMGLGVFLLPNLSRLMPRPIELAVVIALGACLYAFLLLIFNKRGVKEFKSLLVPA